MEAYARPEFLAPLCAWVAMGDEGKVMCFDCKSPECRGCPAACREMDGQIQYYRPPIHGGANQ